MLKTGAAAALVVAAGTALLFEADSAVSELMAACPDALPAAACVGAGIGFAASMLPSSAA
jgi:hypothetical protein